MSLSCLICQDPFRLEKGCVLMHLPDSPGQTLHIFHRTCVDNCQPEGGRVTQCILCRRLVSELIPCYRNGDLDKSAEMIEAAGRGDAVALETLLGQYRILPTDHSEAVIWAASSGSLETLEVLLRRQGIDPKTREKVLRAAIYQDDVATVEVLLRFDSFSVPPDLLQDVELHASTILRLLLDKGVVSKAKLLSDFHEAARSGATGKLHSFLHAGFLSDEEIWEAIQEFRVWAAASGKLSDWVFFWTEYNSSVDSLLEVAVEAEDVTTAHYLLENQPISPAGHAAALALSYEKRNPALFSLLQQTACFFAGDEESALR